MINNKHARHILQVQAPLLSIRKYHHTHDHSPLVVLIPLVVQLQLLFEMSNHHYKQPSKGHGSFHLLTIPHPPHQMSRIGGYHLRWSSWGTNKKSRKQNVASWKRTHSSLYERAVPPWQLTNTILQKEQASKKAKSNKLSEFNND